MINVLRNKRGMALILGFAFIIIFSAITILSINTIISGFKLTKKLSYSNKAFYLAESGVQKALYELRKTWDWDPADTGDNMASITWLDGTTYNGGQYEVIVTTESGRKRVVSYGYFSTKYGSNALAKRAVEAEITNPTAPWLFDTALTAGSDINLIGPNWSIGGPIKYGDTIDPTTVPNSQKFDEDFPLLDFDQLRNMAVSQVKADGQNNLYTQTDVDSGKPYPESFWYTYTETEKIPNVVYIETNLVLRGNVPPMGGFFVVAGNVVTNPNPEDVQADTTVNGNGTIDGVVYTLGNFRVNGGGNGLGVTGGAWARDDVRLNGNSKVGYYPSDPDRPQAYRDAIETLNIGMKPQIVSWKEKYN